MQKEEYSLNDVEGCKQPNLEPTAFNAKKALLPDEQRSVVRRTEDGETVWRIPKWCWESHSGMREPPTNHFRSSRFLLLETGDSPKTSTADLAALKW